MSVRGQNKIKLEDGSSSMTDLVFLLLIFFIILSTLADQPTDVNLPDGGKPSPENKEATKIEVYADGSVKVNNLLVSEANIENAIMKTITTENNAIEIYGDIKSQYKYIYSVIEIGKKNNLRVALMSN